ncbi:MAG: hypothetical protein HY561_10185, partial [Gemmatimonadetes bacterium]|nr:hypothetical protein [Gemmatimonadota bacterium]
MSTTARALLLAPTSTVAAGLLALAVATSCAPAARAPDAAPPVQPPGAAGRAAEPLPDSEALDPKLLEPGVSRELAERRASTLGDVAYELELDVTDTLRADGRVRITFTRKEDAGHLILDFRGSALHSLSANGEPLDHPEFGLAEGVAWEGGHIIIPERFLRAGKNQLELYFSSVMAAAGTSIIRFRDPTDGETYLYTLLVPSDAHQLFPCFDQPDLKAPLRLTVNAPEAWVVVSNGRLEAAWAPADTSGHWFGPGHAWSFVFDQPISTYVYALAAGPWARVAIPWPERPVRFDVADPDSITLYLRRSRRAEADADTLLGENLAALRWMEQYFGQPYPFHKLDLVLAPAFPFGGMEHAGAIFYNESRFIFREPPTPDQRWARAATIYHEVAHQWFGDYVTMEWFDDLWLKEGFATYVATHALDALRHESGAWRRFYLRTKPPAYAVEVTSGTVPVWQALPNLDLAKSNYGPIVYNKAPAILRQLEYLVGDTAFRQGVRLFLERHALSNATWRDLLAAIGDAARHDLGAFGEHYILRAGMPLVQTELALENGRIQELALVQRPAGAFSGGGDQLRRSERAWPGKVRVRIGYEGEGDVVIPVTFAGKRTLVPQAAGLPAPDFVWANDGDYGYGLFLPDAKSAAWFEANVGRIQDPLLRAMAWGALWDLVRNLALSPHRYVQRVLDELPREQDETLAGTVLGRAL